MKKRQLQNSAYLSVFCNELSYILRAGLSLSTGLALLRDGDNLPDSRTILTEIYDKIESGLPLSEALQAVGGFPGYMVRMIALSERTGQMEAVLKRLSKHYKRQNIFYMGVCQALLYPIILLTTFAVVVCILVTKILPIFEEIFIQMDTTLTPITERLLALGRTLTASASIFAVFGVLLALAALVLIFVPQMRKELTDKLYYRFGAWGLWGDFIRARFADGLAMGLSSGLEVGESLSTASALVEGNKKMDEQVSDCKAILEREGLLSVALADAGIFAPMDSRMLALGLETGNIDAVMEQIADRLETAAKTKLDMLISAIEPTIVVIMSVTAGVILLSVIIPLLGIMSGVG